MDYLGFSREELREILKEVMREAFTGKGKEQSETDASAAVEAIRRALTSEPNQTSPASSLESPPAWSQEALDKLPYDQAAAINAAPFSEVRPTEFNRMKKADALEAYLKKRGNEATFDEAIQAIIAGGVKFKSDPSTHYRVMRIAISSNAERFVTHGNMVGLKEWEEKKK